MRLETVSRLLASGLLLTCVGLPVAQAQGPSHRLFAFSEEIRGNEQTEIRWPLAVAAANNDQIGIVDAYQNRFLLLERQGASWTYSRTVKLPQTPAGVAWDGSRYVISMRDNGGLLALEGKDLLQRKVALPVGVVPGPLAHVSGGLLVFDFARQRVLLLGPGDKVVRDIAVGELATGLAAAANGDIFVALGDRGEVRRYDASGTLAATWALPGDGPVPAWPTGIAIEAGGNVIVVDRHNGRLLILDATGKLLGIGSRQGWDAGLLLFPAGLCRFPDGRIAVADEGNGRLQVFTKVTETTSP